MGDHLPGACRWMSEGGMRGMPSSRSGANGPGGGSRGSSLASGLSRSTGGAEVSGPSPPSASVSSGVSGDDHVPRFTRGRVPRRSAQRLRGIRHGTREPVESLLSRPHASGPTAAVATAAVAICESAMRSSPLFLGTRTPNAFASDSNLFSNGHTSSRARSTRAPHSPGGFRAIGVLATPRDRLAGLGAALAFPRSISRSRKTRARDRSWCTSTSPSS